jgi:hypothetical protein
MVKRLARIVAEKVAEIPRYLDGWTLLTITCGSNGELILLWVNGPFGSGTHGVLQVPTRPENYRIDYQSNGEWQQFQLHESTENFTSVQRFGDEGWVLVRGRAKDESDQNACVFGATGDWIRSFHIGDGVEDIQSTSQNEIWVSYFDEGVFSSVETGRGGLLCFDSQGKKIFDYQSLAIAVPPIADCYSLNVVNDQDVWLHYYTDFPLVKLHDKQLSRTWSPTAGASKGFAVYQDRALFAEAYKRRWLMDFDLHTGQSVQLTPVDKEGQAIQFDHSFGRAHDLYLCAKSDIFRIDLSERPLPQA